jgi:hypothetical protein
MDPNALLPPRLELEAFRRSVNRKLWVAIGLLFLVALGCVLLALLAIIRPMPVLAFDARGRPILFEDTVTPRLQLSDLRIEYFTERFLEKFVGIDSANVTDDFSDALNMMTPRLRRIVIDEGRDLERKRKHQDSNLKSRFEEVEIRIAPYDPDRPEQRLHIIAFGRMSFGPKLGAVEESAVPVEQFFFSQVVLVRVPITKLSIHGLEVDFVHTRFFESKAEMEAFAGRAAAVEAGSP